MPNSGRVRARKVTNRKRENKANAAAIKSLKADNARRTKAMNTAAKSGLKLSGSRYEDGSVPNFTKRELTAIAAYSKTKAAEKDIRKAASARRQRTADIWEAKQRSKRRSQPARKPKYTG